MYSTVTLYIILIYCHKNNDHMFVPCTYSTLGKAGTSIQAYFSILALVMNEKAHNISPSVFEIPL